MDWLEHDEVRAKELPVWAQTSHGSIAAAPFRVELCAEGVVLRAGRRASALRFSDILASIPIDDEPAPRLLIAAARRPPRPPWFELRGDSLDAIARAVREGVALLSAHGYRSAPRVRPVLSEAEVLDAVRARRPLAGAVEIRVPELAARRAVVSGLAGGGAAFSSALALVLSVPGFVGASAFALSGAFGLVGGAALAARQYRIGSRHNRVLVLTPDAFVGGLDGRAPRAVAWRGVERFAIGVDRRGEPALEVHGVDGRREARVSHVFFGEPLHVIVAIAEAYRRRAAPR